MPFSVEPIQIKIKFDPKESWMFRIEIDGHVIASWKGYTTREGAIQAANVAKHQYQYREWVVI